MSEAFNRAEDAAAAWDARLRGAKATFRNRRAFQQWLHDNPENQTAHDRLQTALSVLQAHAGGPEISALRDEARNSVHQNKKQRLISIVSLAVAAVLLVALFVGLQTSRDLGSLVQSDGGTVYATAADERTKVTLGDGSVVTLDSGTRLAVKIGKSRRDITLLSGRALFQVAKDRRRPFVVKAGERTITALGTVFDVRVSTGELRVTLAEGSVAVGPVRVDQKIASQILTPRQQFVEIAGKAGPELRTVDTDKALGWAEGQVFFEDEPLASAVEQMNQYATRKIVVDPAVARLRINGMFRSGNQDGFIKALKVTLPVDVREDSTGRIFVSRHPSGSSRSEGN